MIDSITIDELLKLNIEKYLNWVLTNEEISPTLKAKYLAESPKTTFWKAPTIDEIDAFPVWRKMSFDEAQSFYKHTLDGSPWPLEALQKTEVNRVSKLIKALYEKPYLCVLNTWVCDKYFELATVIGLLDHIKKVLDKASEPKINTKIKKDQTPDLFTLLPDNLSVSALEYIRTYSKTTPAGLAALVVALGIEKTEPMSKLIGALNEFYKVKMTRQNFKPNHLDKYIMCSERSMVRDVRFKEIQAIKKVLK